ncbi:hypothetical protein BD311DRAFT_769569 [Dichomitus squalens]|uniref:Uncharacterized protein n=1 Tax=Dichomitus squalens TaxID=114155 RepID=A0A4Q9MAG0_9APHY|nr:hypothetical protein BD311DRAFT_769569 [Dichomitus squalens]
MFSRNHTAVQAQPTQLFFELQVEVELVAEPVEKVGRGAPSVVYAASFGGTTKNTKPTDLWSSDVPSCVSRARGLMLHRGKLETSTSAVVINRLVIWAWRTSGNRKGLTLDAAQSPVVILCLGADVELTFFCPREPDARRTAHRHKAKSSKKVVGTGYEIDGDYQDEKHATRSVAKKRATGQRGQHAEEALTTTLVHGDLLVMEGVVFEYTLKKTGMSILLIGSQL